MMEIFSRRDRWGNMYSVWILSGVLFSLPLIIWLLSGVHLENDVSNWLPKDDPQARLLSWYQSNFETEDRILVSWERSSLTDPKLEELAVALEGNVLEDGTREGGSPLVESAVTPKSLISRMMRQDIPAETAIERVDGLLIGGGPVHIRFSDRGRARGHLMAADILKVANDQLNLHAEIVEQPLAPPVAIEIDLNDERGFKLQEALEEYVLAKPLYDLQISWPTLNTDHQSVARFKELVMSLRTTVKDGEDEGASCVEEVFRYAGSPAAVSISLSEAGKADHKVAVAAIKQAALDIGITADDLHIGGRPTVTAALSRSLRGAMWNRDHPVWNLPYRSPILFSALVGTLMAFVMLKSVRLALLVQLTSFFVVMATTSLVPLFGGSMNMVVVVMPNLLFVLTMSATIHLANYWRHSRINDPIGSTRDAVSRAYLPCLLASCTTAVGMLSLLSSPLAPVKQFGIYSAVGCAISFSAVVLLLPSLMTIWRDVPGSDAAQSHGGFWHFFGQVLVRRRGLVVVTCLVVAITCTSGLRKFRTETKVIRNFPASSRLVMDYVHLENSLSGIVSVDTIVRFDEAAQKKLTFHERAGVVLRVQESVKQHPDVSGVLSLASFLDLQEKDVSGMSAFRRGLERKKQKEVEERILEKVNSHSHEGNAYRSFLAKPDEAYVWDESTGRTLNDAGDELWRVTAQAAIMSDIDYSTLIAEMDELAAKELRMVGTPGTGHVVAGLVPIFLRTQQAVLDSLISSFLLAFALIAVIMMVVLRNPIAGLITMLPNLLPVLAVFGLLSWAGIPTDIGTMITASVALGIAVDGTLHLLTWYRNLVAEGVPQHEAVARSLEHCAPAMWQTSIIIGAGMITLLPVELLLISRFGLVMAMLIVAALLADVVMLPALLAGPLGHMIRKSVMKSGVLVPQPAPAPVPEPAGATAVPRRGTPVPEVGASERQVAPDEPRLEGITDSPEQHPTGGPHITAEFRRQQHSPRT